MKRLLLLSFLFVLAISVAAETRSPEQGTIVRMRMADCVGPQHGFVTMMSGVQAAAGEQCPEYVLVTDRVVYVIVGKSSDQLIPLAETTPFHLQNNEVVIRIDDARRESRFHVKAMTLRPEWDRYEQIAQSEALAAAHHHIEGAALVTTQQ